MRRCLILRQGTSPLRPPAPFPSGSMFQNGKNLSRVRKPRKNRALDRFLPFRRATGMRERGAPGRGAHRRRATQPKTTDLSNQKLLAAATSDAVQQPQVLAADLWPVL